MTRFLPLLILALYIFATILATVASDNPFHILTADGPQSMQEGERLWGLGEYDQAAQYFWRAILIQSHHMNDYTVENAFTKFIQCYSVRQRTEDGFVYIAKEYMRRQQYDLARQYLNQALLVNPTHSEALALRGQMEIREPEAVDTKMVLHNADTSFESMSAIELYEYGAAQFTLRNYELCAQVFELSCMRSNLELGPSCTNAIYCRMMNMDWGFNGTGFDSDMNRLRNITEMEIARWRNGTLDTFSWKRAVSVHPHMMLGYPMPPIMKRYVAESVAFMDDIMARLSSKGVVQPLPDDLPINHTAQLDAYMTEALDPNFRLKVGFISSGFNSKAVLYLSQDIFRFYNRSNIEIHIFSLGPPDNKHFISHGMRGVDWRERVIQNVDHFHDIQNLKGSHIEMARYIHGHGIHILIEWDGYARQGERAQGLMALRPAPIQILHQEYLGTSGAKYMDYIFTDKITSPPETSHLYTEKFIYLPNHFFSKGHAVQSEVIPPRHDYRPPKVPYTIGYGSPQENRCMASGIEKPTFVFCNFNKFLKNNPETVRSWMRILRETPGSILCLLENPSTGIKYLKRFINEASQESTEQNELEKDDSIPTHGETIMSRIFFLPWEHNPFDHQQRNHDFCNAMLDSHPYNGHTVAQDALYAGVPIVTRSDGEDMSSRVTTSANIVLGLEELNAYNGPKQYEDIAIQLGTNASKYNNIRTRLVNSALQRNPMHPYWDAARYARNFENGLSQTWKRFLSGLEPEIITVIESEEISCGTYDNYLLAHPSDPQKYARAEL